LLEAWKEFARGKRKRLDVQQFQLRLMQNILLLHSDLESGSYVHGGYHAFKINDPKQRDIHKASVRDRLVHHALYRKLYPFFDRTFFADSYSCRVGKGTHAAMARFQTYAQKVSKNRTRTCWVLKCDIRKFFASIDQDILLHILRRYIQDEKILALVTNILNSFSSLSDLLTNVNKSDNCKSRHARVGLPLGNLTSQLFVNIYMNEFDQFVKHRLKAKYYIRYADDFVFLSYNKQHLESLLPRIQSFLHEKLQLGLHPRKVFLKTLASGVDFLGWVHFSDHRALRTNTKKRMFRRLKENGYGQHSVESYLGVLSHGNARELQEKVRFVLQSKQTHAL
jgi:retron-type reverse transcriptase